MNRLHASALLLAIILDAVTLAARTREPDPHPLALEQAEKQGPPEPTHLPSFVDKVRRYVKDKRLVERLAPEEGFYPRIGGLTTGGGFAGGGGYRTRVFNDAVLVDLSGAVSTKGYKAADGKVRWLQVWNDRLEVWNELRYRDFPQEDFWGVGEDSIHGARSDYAIRSGDVIARALLRLRGVRIGADVGYFVPSVRSGEDRLYPSVEERFGEVQIPGFALQPDFIHNTIFIEVDYRDHPGNARKGGFYRAAYSTWDDHNLDLFDFRRFEGQAAQFVPLLPQHVLAVRLGVTFNNNETGQRVPFYLMPYIGGADTLRGYHEFRFHDENALFVNSEYRWMPSPFFHVAAFFDAGEVRPNLQQVNFRNLKTSYGIGFRAGTEKRVFLRLDIGTGGNEGTRAFLKFSPSF